MQKTISVNQSRTVDGVTLTLNQVELTDTEMKVYMEKTPVPPYTVFEPPDWRGRADILVTIDLMMAIYLKQIYLATLFWKTAWHIHGITCCILPPVMLRRCSLQLIAYHYPKQEFTARLNSKCSFSSFESVFIF